MKVSKLLKPLAFLVVFSVTAVPAMLALPATAAAPAAGDQSVRLGTMPPALDGSLTDWDGVPLMVLDFDTRAPNSSGAVERSDAFYTLQLLQTADALYLGLHARDEKLVADSGSELHKDDALRFSVDGNRDGAGGAASDHAYRIRIDGKVNDNGGPEITTLTVITAAVTGGYNMEVKIPATALALPLGSTSFKFDWAAGDDDNGGGLDTFYLYAGTGIDTPEAAWPTATLDGESFTPPGLLEAGRWEWHGGGTLGAVYAGSGGNVWAGGNGVWKTTNNGTNWNRWPLFAKSEVQAIRFWDANRGLALAGNKVYTTEDGGATWRLSYDAGNNTAVKLVTSSTDTAWLSLSIPEWNGDFSRAGLIRSRDGGATWQWVFNTGESMLEDVAAYGADRAWALDSEASDSCQTRLHRTTDNGTNWTSRCVADGAGQITGKFIAFADPLTGYLVGQQGSSYYQVWRTMDAGDTWQKQSLGVENVAWLTAYDAKTAWLASAGKAYRTTDGATWYFVGEGAPTRVSFRNASEGWGVEGRAIRRTTTGGATWSTVYTPGDTPLARWWDHLRGWRINGATVERTLDGGATWLASNTGLTAVDHLQMVSPQVGWAWHDASLSLRRTTDGGATWATQVTGSDALLDLQFVNATYGWVRDTAGNLRRTTNGGATWSLVTAPPLPAGPTSLIAVRFANFNVGVAGMAQASACLSWFSRTTDGGLTWSAPQAGPSNHFTFGTPQIGWGASYCDLGPSYSDNLHKTTDGALSWVGLNHPDFVYTDLQAYDAEQLFAYSQGPRIDKSSDGGATFRAQRTETSNLTSRSQMTTVFNEEPGSNDARMIYRNTEIPAYRTMSALRIDGNLDDWGRAWQTSLKTSNAATAQGGIPTPLQSSGALRALWDANNVYLAIQVYDDEIHVDSPTQPWHDDAVEIAFDPAHDHINQTPDDDRQYTITAHGAQYLWGAPTVGLEVMRRLTDNGYILEIRIPHDRMPSLKLSPGAVAGFNFSVLDDIDGGTAETRLFWTGNITSRPQANWGQIRFSAIDAETQPSADTPTPTPTATGSPTPTATPSLTPWPDNNVLRGHAWRDQDGDGIIDPGEPGLVNVAIRLYKNGAQIGQTVTDGSGNYAFTSLIAGEYTVKATQPAWLPFSSTPNEATVTIESGAVEVNFGDWEGLRGYLPMLLK